MTLNTCLFLRPETEDVREIGTQTQELRDIFETALELADLQLDPARPVTVDGISEELIAQVWAAELVLVDANSYGGAGAPFLSPYLTYLIALRHTLGNRTLLIARNDGHLPPGFRKHHTLRYDPENPQRFYKDFRSIIGKMRSAMTQGTNEDSDNPVQAYLQGLEAREKLDQADRLREELKQRDAELDRLKTQQARGGQPQGRINFRPVG